MTKLENLGEDERFFINTSNVSESMSTTIDNEQSLLGSTAAEGIKQHGVMTNVIDMCFRNNSNPRYDLRNWANKIKSYILISQLTQLLNIE